MTRAKTSKEPSPCVACADVCLVEIRPVREDAGVLVDLRVVLDGRRGYGRFAARICTRCERVDWYAYDLDELKDAARRLPETITLVEQKNTNTGPYR